MRTITAPGAPRPAGHYAQAVENDGIVYISGQLPVLPDGTHQPALRFEDQARQALGNLLAIIREAGAAPHTVLRITAYIVGVENWPLFNSIYAELLGDARPARTVVPVPELHYGYKIEVDAVALVEPQHDNARK
jgi:reactive intermediate/imine deaminase